MPEDGQSLFTTQECVEKLTGGGLPEYTVRV